MLTLRPVREQPSASRFSLDELVQLKLAPELLKLDTSAPPDVPVFSVQGLVAFEIAPVFRNTRLELMRLLREASNIEHALAVQYIYAAYSLTDRYELLRGLPMDNADGLLGVAVQEMHHLKSVNLLLRELGGEPTFDRQDFPIRTNIYPFDFELEPLSKGSLAKYLNAESPPGELDPNRANDEAERSYRAEVAALLNGRSVNHIGSLYRTIMARLDDLATDPVGAGTIDIARWKVLLDAILGQGERDHYLFFKSVFQATHPAFAGTSDPWNPSGPNYPARNLPKNPTAFEGTATTIVDDTSRKVALLSNLHYWIMLELLRLGFSFDEPDLIGRAVQHMTGAIGPLARLIAERGSGVPFDSPGLNIGPGVDRASTVSLLTNLLDDTIALQTSLGATVREFGYRSALAQQTKVVLANI